MIDNKSVRDRSMDFFIYCAGPALSFIAAIPHIVAVLVHPLNTPFSAIMVRAYILSFLKLGAPGRSKAFKAFVPRFTSFFELTSIHYTFLMFGVADYLVGCSTPAFPAIATVSFILIGSALANSLIV
jgi:hypothetical protein